MLELLLATRKNMMTISRTDIPVCPIRAKAKQLNGARGRDRQESLSY